MLTREEKIKFIVSAVQEIEGVNILEMDQNYFDSYSDEQLDKDVDWYDYLLGK